jgi:hypothetical protein
MIKASTEIQHRAELPTPSPRVAQSLSPEQLAAHRQRIAFDVEVVLSGYWQSFPPAAIKAGILADWCDALEDWTPEQILYALRKWRNDFPDKRPNPGHIVGMMKDLRGRMLAKTIAPAAEPEAAPRISKEAAADIMAAHGFRPKTFID